MPNTTPVVDTAPVLGALLDQAARDARVPVGFLACITRGMGGQDLTEMAELADVGAFGFTDDGRPVADAGVMRRALQYQRLAGRVLALHEEDPSLSGTGAMHEGAVSARLGIAGIPSVSESVLVARDCQLAGYEDGRIHLQHLSSSLSVEAVAAAKAAGVQVTCEASPHHLTLTDEDVDGLDTRLKMNPPLRTAADRRALVDGLRDGTIDCVATDHAPHARDEKEVAFEQAPMGTTGLETSFAALHTELVLGGLLDLATLVDRMCVGGVPFGIPQPRIATGQAANLTLVDLDRAWVVGENGYESRSDNCCFAGRELRGRVLLTIAAGSVAYRERAFALTAA
jgi:dihydroorotase